MNDRDRRGANDDDVHDQQPVDARGWMPLPPGDPGFLGRINFIHDENVDAVQQLLDLWQHGIDQNGFVADIESWRWRYVDLAATLVLTYFLCGPMWRFFIVCWLLGHPQHGRAAMRFLVGAPY